MSDLLMQLYANIFALRLRLAEARESARTASQAADLERQLCEAQIQFDTLVAEANQ